MRVMNELTFRLHCRPHFAADPPDGLTANSPAGCLLSTASVSLASYLCGHSLLPQLEGIYEVLQWSPPANCILIGAKLRTKYREYRLSGAVMAVDSLKRQYS